MKDITVDEIMDIIWVNIELPDNIRRYIQEDLDKLFKTKKIQK